MKRNLIVIQEDSKDCGVACLLSIIKYYKGNYPFNKLVELTQTTKKGTTFYNIKLAAQEIGLSSQAYYSQKVNELEKIQKPILCQLNKSIGTHFVVVYKISPKSLTIMDPSVGKRLIEKSEFFSQWTGYIMIFEPYKQLPCLKNTNYLNKIIIETIKKNKIFVINIIFLSILFTILSCLNAFYLEVVISKINIITISNLKKLTIIFLIMTIIKCTIDYTRNKLIIKLNQKIDCSLISNTFHKILLLPYNYYKSKTTGDIISRINDLAYIKILLNKIILTVLLDFLISISAGIILYKINHSMFLLLLIIILGYIVCFSIFRPLIKKQTNLSQESKARINSYIIENINGFETIKGLNMESKILSKFLQIHNQDLKISSRLASINNKELLTNNLLVLIGTLLINYLGFFLLLKNKINLGNLITYNTLMIYFIEPIRNTVDINKDYYYIKNAITRANNLFEVETENLNYKNNITLMGKIKFKNLSFNYHQNVILKNINLTINKYSKVLLLGASGTGKSTLLKLLEKYYEVENNSIYLDEYDINELTIADIRNNITYISQNEILYTDTIKNNITMDREISKENFEMICKITCIDEFVNELFLKYNTILEENGLNLSGGQRQRIILARALLKPSSIIIIDEGLNAMDINLERKILKNIFKIYKEKTFILVSHRKENMDLFDQVIELKAGKINKNLKRKEN